MDPRYADVVALLSRYFDGLYTSDNMALAEVFHPKAVYVCASEEPLVHLKMSEYLPIVEKRPSPASRNEPRKDRILSIAFAGPVTAFAQVNCAIGDRYFTDFLSLIQTEGRWQIISKVFHYDRNL